MKQIPIMLIKPYFTFRHSKLGSSGQVSIEFKLVWLRVKERLMVNKEYSQLDILELKRAEWRRIFQHMHITRKQLLELPLDIRQDILKQQVDNYVQNIPDKEKLGDLHKLD